MRHTNSAPTSGMHHCFFTQGLTSPFERTPYRFVGDLLHYFELYEFVGEHPHAPALLAFRRIAASQSHHIRFLLAHKLALAARTWRFVESPLQSSLHEALARPLYRAHAREQCLGDLLVGAPLFCQQQDARSIGFPDPCLTSPEQTHKLFSFVGRQVDHVHLRHRETSCSSWGMKDRRF